jgi:hypothetical protein
MPVEQWSMSCVSVIQFAFPVSMATVYILKQKRMVPWCSELPQGLPIKYPIILGFNNVQAQLLSVITSRNLKKTVFSESFVDCCKIIQIKKKIISRALYEYNESHSKRNPITYAPNYVLHVNCCLLHFYHLISSGV